MRVGITTDYRGFSLKEELVAHLRRPGYELINAATHEHNLEEDYPDVVILLARDVTAGKVERGITICGSRVGASV